MAMAVNNQWQVASYHGKKLKSSRTCLIGYSGFISREWFLIAHGDGHTDTHTNFKEPGMCLVFKAKAYVAIKLN